MPNFFEIMLDLGKLQRLAEERQAQLAEEAPTTVGEIQSVDSSVISTMQYDATTMTMHVTFKGGAMYDYTNVPAGLAQRWMEAPSKGTFLNQTIKKSFIPYTRVG